VSGWASKSDLDEIDWIYVPISRSDIGSGYVGFCAFIKQPSIFTALRLRLLAADKEGNELRDSLQHQRLLFGRVVIESVELVGEHGVWISGWTADPEAMSLQINGKYYSVDTTCTYFYNRTDVSAVVGDGAKGFVTGLLHEINRTPNTRISVQINLNGIEQQVFEVQRDHIRNRIKTAKLLLALPTPLEGLRERFDLVEMGLLSKQHFPSESGYVSIRNNVYVRDLGIDISIVIPFYGNLHFAELQAATISRLQQDISEKIEIVYVNDNPDLKNEFSRTIEALTLKYGMPMTLVQNAENVGFSESVNNGVKESSGGFTMILNSDCFFDDCSKLSQLIQLMDSLPVFGLVAPISLRPDRSVDHIQMEPVFVHEKSMYFYRHLGQGVPHDSIKMDNLVEVDFVTGCCLLTTKENFVSAGMFDTSSVIGDFEDASLCLQYRSNGLHVAATSLISVIHLGRASLREVQLSEIGERVSALNALIHNRYLGCVNDNMKVEVD
jgi:GT2 family glycosyltransferase